MPPPPLDAVHAQKCVICRESHPHMTPYYQNVAHKHTKMKDVTFREKRRSVRLPAVATRASGPLNRIAGDHQISSCTVDAPFPSLSRSLRPCPDPTTSSGGATTQVQRAGRPPDPQSLQTSGSASATKASRPSREGEDERSNTVTVNTSLVEGGGGGGAGRACSSFACVSCWAIENAFSGGGGWNMGTIGVQLLSYCVSRDEAGFVQRGSWHKRHLHCVARAKRGVYFPGTTSEVVESTCRVLTPLSTGGLTHALDKIYNSSTFRYKPVGALVHAFYDKTDGNRGNTKYAPGIAFALTLR